MKTIIAAMVFCSSFAWAAVSVEPGLYSAIDTDSKTVKATILLRKDQTVNFKVSTPDFTMPDPGCEGTYAVAGSSLAAEMSCPMDGMEKVKVSIDLTNVTPELLISEAGVVVPVVLDIVGPEPINFNLKKIE